MFATVTPSCVYASRQEDIGLIFGLAETQLGVTVANIAHVLLVTSIVAATVSFHNTVARYMFSLGREGVLPRALGHTSPRSSSPRAASLVQSAIGGAVIAGYALGGLDPLVELFFYAGTAGGLGVLMLITTTAIAIVVYFVRNPHGENRWRSRVAPVLATCLLLLVCTAGIVNMPELLGTPPGSVLPWVVPGVYLAAALAGVAWGRELAVRRPEVYSRIGLGAQTAQSDRPRDTAEQGADR